MTMHSLCGSISGPFDPSRTRYANTFIDYQGAVKREPAPLPLLERASEAGGQIGSLKTETKPFGFGEGLPPKESRRPVFCGLDAGARGFADYTTPDADALLVWYRSAGRAERRAVQLYLARRAVAAGWSCSITQAKAVIEDAMFHVLIPPGRRGAPTKGALTAGMRKREFYRLRADAGAWLRAGILDAEYRHALARG